MTVTAQKEDSIYVVRISGLLKKAEWDAIQAAAKEKLGTASDIKVLVVLDNFQGWAKDDGWGNMDFYIEFREKITKIAFVGDPSHETEMMMFAGAGFRPCPVKYFPPAQLDLARKWLV